MRIIRENIMELESRSSDEFDLDAHEDEVRPISDGEFESVHLRENLAKSTNLSIICSNTNCYHSLTCTPDTTRYQCLDLAG